MGLFSITRPDGSNGGDYFRLPTSSSESPNPSNPSNKPSSPSSTASLLRTSFLRIPAIRLGLLALSCFLIGHFSTSWLSPSRTASSLAHLFLVTDDKHHRVFDDVSPGQASTGVMPIRAYEAMSDQCVEEWVVRHRWGESCKATDLSAGLKLDGVWAWVNGSDPAQIASRQRYRPSSSLDIDAAHRYADHNELLYSMRSFLASVGGKALSRMHILASAYPLGDAVVGNGTKMVGQIPHWLDKDALLDKDSKIVLHHDSEYFAPLPARRSAPIEQEAIQEWREAVIPSFNSLAVESQMYNLPSTSSDQMVYLNDDFFTLRENVVADYSSPLFGPVIKALPRITSMYAPSEEPIYRYFNPSGEEVGIKRAAWFLGQRFPMRSLPYITHHPRTLWLPLLREAAQTFPEAFANTTLARFRAQQGVPASIQAVFLASWYVVERHREALLWSWVVAKWGGAEESLTTAKKETMWDELVGKGQGSGKQTGSRLVKLPERQAIEDSSAFEAAGVERPRNTEYSFSSKDGYALGYLDALWFWDRPRNGWPDLAASSRASKKGGHDGGGATSGSHSRPNLCSVKRDGCLNVNVEETPADLFKRIAFEEPECGDCAIAALMEASGTSGISAFLPLANAARPPSRRAKESSELKSSDMPPHLPITSSWRETRFDLSYVLRHGDDSSSTRSLRTWTTRLIQRYSYVLGTTPSELFKMERPEAVERKLNEVDKDGELTYLCLNDDVEEGTEEINTLLSDWFQKRWAGKLPGEI